MNRFFACLGGNVDQTASAFLWMLEKEANSNRTVRVLEILTFLKDMGAKDIDSRVKESLAKKEKSHDWLKRWASLAVDEENKR